MIYADSAATSLHKPPQVAQAVYDAVLHLGNSGRGGNSPSLDSARTIFSCRQKLSRLFEGEGPEQVVFSSNATESLNIALKGLFQPGDHILTTELEHNSVLRPLYELEHQGVLLTILPCRNHGTLDPADGAAALRPNTKALVCTHASNVTGNVNPLSALGDFCHTHGLLFLVDAAQTAGIFPLSMRRDQIHVLAFTGHKSLLGPQGIGGLCLKKGLSIRPLKTGGTGVHSFQRSHPDSLPTALEAGTLNAPGIAGLSAGLDYLFETGMDLLRAREQALLRAFYERVAPLPGITLYGDFSGWDRAPILSLNVRDLPSSLVADQLQERFGIAVRAGAHCAPLVHRRFGTVEQGMVRFSFSWGNTLEEVEAIADALQTLLED